MARQSRRRRGFGRIRKLPSRRWQAAYTGPDMAVHNAPSTFDTAEHAEKWLAAERELIAADEWTSPSVRKTKKRLPQLTLASYAETWLATKDLKPRTRQHYRQLLDRFVLPNLGPLPLKVIDFDAVDNWHATLPGTTPTQRAHAYSLLRAIMATAASRGHIAENPCKIQGAGASSRARRIRPATLDELATIVDAMPERLRLLVLLAAWCALRQGELFELRRGDVDAVDGLLHVHRAVTRVNGEVIVGTPKSDAGIRDVSVPPHLIPIVEAHLAEHVGSSPESLMFPSVGDADIQLHANTLYKSWYPARKAAGRPDLRLHDLRHTGAVLAASTGATLAELMGRLGHSTVAAALKYQHAAEGRDAEIASKLSELATSNVVSIESARKQATDEGQAQ